MRRLLREFGLLQAVIPALEPTVQLKLGTPFLTGCPVKLGMTANDEVLGTVLGFKLMGVRVSSLI
jgi:hypothetical protein